RPRRSIPVREEAAAFASSFLEARAPARPRVLISPGTSEAQAYKRYPADLFARIADGIASATSASIILAWGPRAKPIAQEVGRKMSRPHVLAPPTRLTELAEILRGCDLFVGSDTGPLHLAAAVGVKTIAIYGPTDPRVNAAWGADGLSFVGDVACRPCRRRGC